MKLLKVIIFIIVLSQIAIGQYRGTPQLSGKGLPYFEARLIKEADTLNSKLIIIFQILNDDLTFVRKDSLFAAEIEVDINVIANNNIVHHKLINAVYKETDFMKTNDRNKKNFFSYTLNIESGDYLVDLTFKDVFTGQKLKRNYEIVIPGFEENELIVNDVLFYDKVEKTSGKIIAVDDPNVIQNFNTSNNIIYANFSTIVQNISMPVYISCKLVDNAGRVGMKYEYEVIQKKKYMEHWIKIDKKNLKNSQYQFILEVTYNVNTYSKKNLLTFFWDVAPGNINDLDEAINQLSYIAPHDSISKMKKLATEEKRAQFKKMWKVLDPDPDTSINELMDEYYKRVNFTNAKFSDGSRRGWRSDRGRIYIKFGPPGEIVYEKMPLGSQPYELWKYYDLNKEFLFIGNGFGGYDLHPNYINQEYE